MNEVNYDMKNLEATTDEVERVVNVYDKNIVNLEYYETWYSFGHMKYSKDLVIAFGGRVGYSCIDSIFVYSIFNKKWAKSNLKLKYPLSHMSSVLYKDRIHILGGWNNEYQKRHYSILIDDVFNGIQGIGYWTINSIDKAMCYYVRKFKYGQLKY